MRCLDTTHSRSGALEPGTIGVRELIDISRVVFFFAAVSLFWGFVLYLALLAAP